MAYIRGEAREQVTMFPVTLDELIPEEHVCRVIEAFVGRLEMAKMGFVRAEPAETGRPGYDPRDLLKLYLYGYVQPVRSWRRLESECQRNVEVMWLLGRLQPDYKSIAEFRRMHSQAVTETGAELVRLARSVGLVRGETVAVDGSKFRAVSSAKSVRERDAVKRYLEQLDAADEQEEVVIDASAVQAALEKLKNHSEPEARFMRTGAGHAPAYNVQTAGDSEHALIVAQQVTDEATDNRSLSAADGESGERSGRQPASAKGGGRRRLLQPPAGRSLRSPRNRAACARQSHGEQSRRRHTVRPNGVPLRPEDRHFPLPGTADAPAQTTLVPRSRCVLCGPTSGLRCLCPEGTLHQREVSLGLATPARERVAANAAASSPGDDAVATIDRRTSVCCAQVPHLRTPALPSAWTARCAGGD